MDSKKIGLKLRELRGEKTLDEVANDVGVSKSAIAMYERGERIPRDEIKVSLSDYYEVPIADIFFA